MNYRTLIINPLIFLLILSCSSVDYSDRVYPDDDSSYETLFDHQYIHHFEIKISRGEWDGLNQDMLDMKHIVGDNKMRTGNYRKADLIYNGPLGENIFLEDIGFRTRGSSTRTIPQDGNGDYHRSHFKIKFDKEFESNNQYEDRTFCTLNSLNFKWNHNTDLSQIRELYCLDLLNRANVDAARTGSATITINIDGEKVFYGVYTMVEPVNRRFLDRRYDDDGGNLYKCLGGLWPITDLTNLGVRDWQNNYFPNYELKTNEDDENHKVLHDFIEEINTLEGDDFEDYIDDNFDIKNFLRYMATNILIGNDDDYTFGGNNYYLYFEEDDKKVRFIPHDFDKGLGRESDLSEEFEVQPILEYPPYILSTKILSIDRYREKYLENIEKNLDPERELFYFEDYKNRFDYLYDLYSPYLDTPMDEGEFMDSKESFSYFQTRVSFVKDQLEQLLGSK